MNMQTIIQMNCLEDASKISFLRTYLCEKPIMLLDEPFGKLDAFTKWKYIAGF